MPLPSVEQFIGTNVTEQGFKDAQKQLVEYVGNEVPKKVDTDADFATKANKATTLAGYGIADAYTKAQVDSSITAVSGGHKAYQTLAAAQAAQATLPANTVVEVTNDPTAANNGTYQWNGTTLTKSAYDLLTQAKSHTDTEINTFSNLNGLLSMSAKRKEQTFYYVLNGNLVTDTNEGLFSVEVNVKAGEYLVVNTKSFSEANAFYIVDSNNVILSTMSPKETYDKPILLKIPTNAVKVYINCMYTYASSFSVSKINNAVFELLYTHLDRQQQTFYYSPDGIKTVKSNNNGLFALALNVSVGEYYLINTDSFGIAAEYYIVDASENILQKLDATPGGTGSYAILIPSGGTKLYVNCAYTYADKFNVQRIDSALINVMTDNRLDAKNVQKTFPESNYFDLLRKKCPNFYRKYKDKSEDVAVVLTGTSLTQGNLYTSTRVDASTRPPALHTNDLASSVFDNLIKGWDGQKYRRYDHTDLTYSASAWSIVNRVIDGSTDVWDDYAHIKNGLTKTTTSANASVSIAIPSDAWQFNFVYRTDSQGGDCTVSIAEGNLKVEVFNGTNWVEANGFLLSMYEPPATTTKGNTIYQKRLKMRCKNKATGGINSIGSTKTITIAKGNDATRFNVVGFEWSPREYMLSIINGARGGFEWGDPNGNRLDQYQDSDIWEFNPDLLLAEVTIINWGASEPAALTKDPLHYVNIAKRAYFNEFNDMPTSLYAKSEAYTKCDVIFYSDTPAASSAVSEAWDSVTHEPKFGTVTEAATNGSVVDTINVGRTKTNFENYEAVELYVASKDYLFIPVLGAFKSVAEKYYGSYWQGMQASDKTGTTLSQDGVHFNDNGAALFSKLIASVFDGI